MAAHRRHVGTLEQIGLWEADGVEFVNGHLRAQTAEIDVTDAVVAGEGTFPTLSMARGVPTVVYSQGITGLGLPGEKFTPLRRAHLYTDYSRYPFDALDGPLPEIVARRRPQRRADRGVAPPLRRTTLQPGRVRRPRRTPRRPRARPARRRHAPLHDAGVRG